MDYLRKHFQRIKEENAFFIGLRTIKTVIAVLITVILMFYIFKTTPFFACIGAVVAIERSRSRSINAIIIRNVGTLIGGLVGVLFTRIWDNPVFLAMGILPYIYISNLTGKKDSIVPGAIVYFAVVFMNTVDTAAGYGFKRITETFIGTLIGLLVNFLIFPPRTEEVPKAVTPDSQESNNIKMEDKT